MRVLDVVEGKICTEEVFFRTHDGIDALHSNSIKLLSQYSVSVENISGL